MENIKRKKIIYLDHAATTYLDKKVVKKMEPFFSQDYGNPSSLYSLGREALQALSLARKEVADVLHCQSNEIIFTGSGTESDNLAIRGIALANRSRGNHIITTMIEHPAVLVTCAYLEKEGFKITYLPVDKDGLVNPKDVEKSVTDQTILVSIMYANNEIGTVQQIVEIGKIIKRKRKNNLPYFHTDACQAAGACDLNINNLGVDLLTLNGSKIYGPKGTGMLFVRSGVKLQPLITGGGQELKMRSGTENVAGIVGFSTALKLVQENKEKENKRLIKLRKKLITGIMSSIPKVKLNGHSTQRLPNNVNVSILDIEGEALLLFLDEKGICVSTGSACSSGDLRPSHVLLALGLSYEYAHGSLRLTLGKCNTDADIAYVLDVLPPIVAQLRSISPVKIKNN